MKFLDTSRFFFLRYIIEKKVYPFFGVSSLTEVFRRVIEPIKLPQGLSTNVDYGMLFEVGLHELLEVSIEAYEFVPCGVAPELLGF
jgi:hypothetical protein